MKECEEESNESEVIGEDYFYVINKDEFHAMHVQMIQKQQRQIEAMEREIKESKEQIK